jgi:hypothetical protein
MGQKKERTESLDKAVKAEKNDPGTSVADQKRRIRQTGTEQGVIGR